MKNKKIIAITVLIFTLLNIQITNCLACDLKVITNNEISDTSKKMIDVPYLSQDDIVSGCEAVSSTMVLQFWKYSISAKDFTDKYLIKKNWHISEDKTWYGPDPNAAYPGDPYKKSGLNCGFGCYAPATAKSIDTVLDHNKHEVNVTTGTSLLELQRNYIDNGIPVLIWATMDMKPSKKTYTWKIDYVDKKISNFKIGDEFTWIAGEHCLVLVGYDDTKFYFNDPYHNRGLIGYDKSLVEQRFEELGKQSLVITKKTNSAAKKFRLFNKNSV